MTSGLHSGCASESTESQLHNGFFCPICIQGLPRRCLWGTSNFRNEGKGSSKMADSSANENCYLIANGSCHIEKPVQPIRVVLLIENGSPLWRPHIPKGWRFRADSTVEIECKLEKRTVEALTGRCILNAAWVIGAKNMHILLNKLITKKPWKGIVGLASW